MDGLTQLENRSIYIIREAYQKFDRPALLWSVGKDSTALLWLCYKAFLGRIPFPVIHIDTSYKFPEMYAFRDEYAKRWNLDLIVARNEKALAEGMSHDKGSKLDCCHALKTTALQQVIDKLKLDALFLGIRRDEHGIRAKERYFSPRDQQFQWNFGDQPAELWDQYKAQNQEDNHIRVHPLLHMTELDIWEYTQREEIPISPLYLSNEGKRYRSIGCHTCCESVNSTAATIPEIVQEIRTTTTSERAGRAQDKEDEMTMQKLRALGYM